MYMSGPGVWKYPCALSTLGFGALSPLQGLFAGCSAQVGRTARVPRASLVSCRGADWSLGPVPAL